MSIREELQEFAVRGKAVDRAVGIVIVIGIAAAPGGIVASLASGVILPPIGLLPGRVDSGKPFVVPSEGAAPGPRARPELAAQAGAATLNCGQFIEELVGFIVVARTVSLRVEAVDRLRSRLEAPAAASAAAEPSGGERLPGEIPDLPKTGPLKSGAR